MSRAEIIALIKSIQFDGGSHADVAALEHATGNPDAWVIFDVLELEGMLPEKIFELFFVNHSTV